MDGIVYRVENLTYVYPGRRRRQSVVANDFLTFDVREGEIFGLLGPNGAGKTTLVRQMAGLLKPTDGRLDLLGHDLRRAVRRAAESVAYMSQRRAALADLEVIQAVVATGRLRGLKRNRARFDADRLIGQLSLGHVADRRIGLLSGGEARLAALAITLVGDRPVLLLDEPTADLDPTNRRRVWELLRLRQEQFGTTIVLVTHNVLEAETVFDRVMMMSDGRFLAHGTTVELKAHLSHLVRVEMVVSADGARPPNFPGLVQDVRARGRRRFVGWGPRDRAADLVWILDRTGLHDYSVGTPTLEDLFLMVGGEGELAA